MIGLRQHRKYEIYQYSKCQCLTSNMVQGFHHYAVVGIFIIVPTPQGYCLSVKIRVLYLHVRYICLNVYENSICSRMLSFSNPCFRTKNFIAWATTLSTMHV
jgi:hypothetical protein